MPSSMPNSQRLGFFARHPRATGALILLVLHAVFIAGPWALSATPLPTLKDGYPNYVSLGSWSGIKHDAAPLLIGFVQVFYLLPAMLLTLKLRQPEVAKGMLLAAIATLVLNLGGCGLALWQLSKIS